MLPTTIFGFLAFLARRAAFLRELRRLVERREERRRGPLGVRARRLERRLAERLLEALGARARRREVDLLEAERLDERRALGALGTLARRAARLLEARRLLDLGVLARREDLLLERFEDRGARARRLARRLRRLLFLVDAPLS